MIGELRGEDGCTREGSAAVVLTVSAAVAGKINSPTAKLLGMIIQPPARRPGVRRAVVDFKSGQRLPRMYVIQLYYPHGRTK